MHRFIRSLISLFVIVLAVLAARVHEKGAASQEVESQLVKLCAQDGECLAVLERQFDDCFDKSFDVGGRRNGGSLDTHQMASCLNHGSSHRFFGVHE